MPALVIVKRPDTTTLAVLTKRSNFASKHPGVILVFVIVFIVFLGLAALVVYRWSLRKAARKQNFETTQVN